MFRYSALKAFFVVICLFSQEGYSQSRWGSGIDFTQRAANREKSRWSLSDWLAMKDRNRMMDMWLSVNSPSPFEVSLAAAYMSYESGSSSAAEESKNYALYAGEFSAYAQFIGVGAEYQNSSNEKLVDWAGMLNIRLLGNSIQNTSLTINLGQRTRQLAEEENLVQNFAQGSLQLYLTKYFGIEGRYRSYMPVTISNQEVKSHAIEGGLFIDFKGLRIFGSWYQELEERKPLGGAAEAEKQDRKGIKSGFKIFF